MESRTTLRISKVGARILPVRERLPSMKNSRVLFSLRRSSMYLSKMMR
jgi:hypothetical protein